MMLVNITSNQMNVDYCNKTFADKQFELITVTFCHNRLFLARRTIDTLLQSECPKSTLHIFFVDRSKKILQMLKELNVPEDKYLLIIERSSNLENTEHYERRNWIMNALKNICFDYVCTIDSDFELHSQWYSELKKLTDHFKNDKNIMGFTSFNNCTGTWRHNTYQINELPSGEVYGYKKDVSAGHVLFPREKYFELGDYDPQINEWRWIRQIKEKKQKVITTVPSYAQHLGVSNSILVHNDNVDMALDFIGNYTIPSRFCGVWKCNDGRKLIINRNGFISNQHNVNTSTIIGHLKFLNGAKEAIVAIEEDQYHCHVEFQKNIPIKLKTADETFILSNSIISNWEWITYTEERHNVMMDSKGQFYLFASCINLNNLDKISSQTFDNWQKDNLCIMASDLASLKAKDHSKLLLAEMAPKLIESIGTYNIILTENQHYLVPQRLGRITPENWSKIKRKKDCICAKSLINARKIAKIDAAYNSRYKRLAEETAQLERAISLEGVLSIYTDTMDSFVQKDYNKDHSKKLQELNVYVDMIRECKEQGKWQQAKNMLGNFSKIDIDSLAQRYPLVFEELCRVAHELIEVEIYDSSKEVIDEVKLVIANMLKKSNANLINIAKVDAAYACRYNGLAEETFRKQQLEKKQKFEFQLRLMPLVYNKCIRYFYRLLNLK